MRVFDVPRVIAHRGGRGAECENTMDAFERAAHEGARAIELDVRPCASGEIVVLHDPTLARVTGGQDARAAAKLSWSELSRVPLTGGGRVPRLDDVLSWARARGVVVNVEMKHDVPHRRALARETARSVTSSGAAVVLSSFDPWLLACAAPLTPGVPRAILTYTAEGARGTVLLATARAPLFDAVHLERTQASPRRVRALLRRGLAVGVWTVNAAVEARDLIALGASYVITDEPAAIAAALTAA